MAFTRRSFLAAALGAAALPAAAKPALMLAREAQPGLDPTGWLVSEKFDGTRACWDGHALRFRSGLPVHAPGWFTARLPAVPLDGELWLGRGRFEALSGVVRKAQPVDAEWRELRYMLFDLPGAQGPFTERARRLQALAEGARWPQLVAVEQATLPDAAALARRLEDVVRGGGEGLVLHRAQAHWRAGRSEDLLKLKPLSDAEAVVLGIEPGHGRFEGRMGALRVRSEEGLEFRVGTGFSDALREHPPDAGSVITYTYRGFTAQGVPRFASFLRLREP